ncbi:MAG: YggT family protein [Clostridiales bacterium]|nr:YggT family protein [Clostridiales bacterium]
MKILLIRAIDGMASLIYILIFARCLLSWLPLDRSNKIIDLIYTLTEPFLAPIRRLFDRSPLGGYGMRVDFSPVIAFILISIVRNILVNIIVSYV